MFDSILVVLLFAASASFFIGFLLDKKRELISKFTRQRDDHKAIQASHIGNPLRVGGLAILLSIITSAIFLSPFANGAYAAILFLTVVPVFIGGFLEDLGFRVKPMWRLMAAVLSSILVIVFIGVWLDRLDLLAFNYILQITVVAILLNIAAAAVFCHALNLVDGMNGLAAQIIIYSAFGLAYTAFQADLKQISIISLLIAAATFGFLLHNWPFAKLFLGDAGSYSLGHLLVWLAISLGAYSPDVAVPALLLILFWPLADTIHTVCRRLVNKRSIFEPDANHLHQKVRRIFQHVSLSKFGRRAANPVASLILAPFIALPTLVGVLTAKTVDTAWIAFLSFLFFFFALHYVLTEIERTLEVK